MRKLLLIVDDWEALEWYENRFSADFQVTCAPFGSEGIRLAQEILPDLIFIDLVFEDMTPLEAFQSLQNQPDTCDIRTVMILDPQDLLNFKIPKHGLVVTRPFQLDELLQRLKIN